MREYGQAQGQALFDHLQALFCPPALPEKAAEKPARPARSRRSGRRKRSAEKAPEPQGE